MRFPTPPGVELMTSDVSPGAWLDERLMPLSSEGTRVGVIVPPGFAAYARILHPAQRRVPDGYVDATWAEVAAERGKVIHPEVQFGVLLGDEWEAGTNQWGDGFQPEEGSMPQHVSPRLLPILERHTRTPDECWMCVWDGFGFLSGGALLRLEPRSPVLRWWRRRGALRASRREQQELAQIPTVKIHPAPAGRGAFRAYFLFRGPLSAVEGFAFDGTYQSPNYLWPEDRAWCLATEIDDCSTYVGGNAELVRDLLESNLEVVHSDPENRFDWWGDRINDG